MWESDYHALFVYMRSFGLFVIGDEWFLSVLSHRWEQEARQQRLDRPLRPGRNKIKINKCTPVWEVELRTCPLPFDSSRCPFPFLFSFFPSFLFSCSPASFFLLINSSHGTVLLTSFTSWTITITTTPRTCLMAPHTAFIRQSRRRISTWSTHSKASTPIQSCPPPLPRVGIIHPRVLISKTTSKLLPPFQNSSRLFRCGRP
jgi:hypothetical protein